MSTPTLLHGEPITLTLPHLQLAGKRWGQVGGRRVLALHGWLDNANSFDRLAPLLSGVELVALDLPGHGLSQFHPPGSLYGFIDSCADIVAAIEALGWTEFAILGHSLGAGIALIVAATLPGRVQRLALIDGLGPLTDDADAAPDRFARSLAYERRGNSKRVYPDRETAAQRVVDMAGPIDLESARILVERGTEPVPGGFCWRADPALRVPSRQRLTEPQVHAFLRRVVCPTLLVYTQASFEKAREQVPARAACLAHFEMHEIEAGHHVHLDRAPEVAAVVQPFLLA